MVRNTMTIALGAMVPLLLAGVLAFTQTSSAQTSSTSAAFEESAKIEKAAAPAAKTTAGATVKGSVKFEGTAPAPEKIDMAADPVCHEKHKDAPQMKEDLVVNANGTLKNVFVHVKKGLPEDKKWDPPADPVVFDQVGCHYVPHVFGIMVGQTWRIRNSDPTLHNVHSLPKKNTQFNQAMPDKCPDINQKFRNPEMSVTVKCDVHPWMGAVAYVMKHPFFAVSDDKGEFTIKDLPAGTYTLEAIHEKLGTSEPVEVKVADGESKDVTFSFKAKS